MIKKNKPSFKVCRIQILSVFSENLYTSSTNGGWIYCLFDRQAKMELEPEDGIRVVLQSSVRACAHFALLVLGIRSISISISISISKAKQQDRERRRG
jgi:hypothetical protein